MYVRKFDDMVQIREKNPNVYSTLCLREKR